MAQNLIEFHKCIKLIKKHVTGIYGASRAAEAIGGLGGRIAGKAVNNDLQDKIQGFVDDAVEYTKHFPTEADEMLEFMLYFETAVLRNEDIAPVVCGYSGNFMEIQKKAVKHISKNFPKDKRLTVYGPIESHIQLYALSTFNEYFPDTNARFKEMLGHDAEHILSPKKSDDKEEPSKLDGIKEGASKLVGKIGGFFKK